MAPNKPREPSIERTSEYEDFLDRLEEYHQKRGTHLEREPKVGNRHLDLLRLYTRVMEEGGYDKVSDTKGNKLAWRRIASEFLPGSSNVTTQAFIVKSAYYKNLAAYEISTHHKREPPPKEILEDVSAKGGDLLNRTVENYLRPVSREANRLGDGDESDDEDREHRTPKEDKVDGDDPGSTGGRVTRALRHAPPQRVLFQPEVSGRQTRQTGSMNSPTPGAAHTNGTYGTSGAAMTIANYEPRPPVPSMMKPVTTPANHPDFFRNISLPKRTAARVQINKGVMAPGTGFVGPNIYIRALNALRSANLEEESYALHHLVKISHERGDKYRFDSFPGLAEALIPKVIDVASLFYDVKWQISYVEEEVAKGVNVLNGLEGTSSLLEKLKSLQLLDYQDDLLPADVTAALGRANEAGLIIRNMVMMEENALYLSRIKSIIDMIVIVLNLPNHFSVVELQHYALEIAEQLTKFWILKSEDPLYKSLLAQIDSTDRGRIITALRAIGRIGMNYETTNRLTDVPSKTLQSISDWLLIEDEELRNSCLDFLYQYTGFTDNVEILVNEVNVEGLVSQLVRLLLHGATPLELKPPKSSSSKPSQHADNAPKLSASIIEQLVNLEEPERSSQWLRTCFEEDPSGEITQIQLWSGYNAAFSEIMLQQPQHRALMPAKDFITNVSTTFSSASAQVINISPTQQKYLIRGIRPRAVPVDPVTRKAYMRCQWHPQSKLNGHTDTKHSTANLECGEYAAGPKAMWEHIITSHLKIPRDESGKWLLEQKPDIQMTNGDATATKPTPRYHCHWGGCTKFGAQGSESAFEVGQHVKTHLPDTSALHSIHAKHNKTPETSNPLSSSAQVRYDQFQPQFGMPVGLGGIGMGGRHHDSHKQHGGQQPIPSSQQPPNVRYLNTQEDERKDAAGIPYAAVLVLRNLARQMGKLDPPAKKTNGLVRKRSRERMENEDAGERLDYDDVGSTKKRKVDEDVDEEEGWVRKVFAPVKEQLYYVMAHNWTLREYMVGLNKAIAAGGG